MKPRNLFARELTKRKEAKPSSPSSQSIKGVDPFTAMLANTTGRGRVGRHSIANGRMAVIPNNLVPKNPEPSREPLGRSYVSEGGIFDARSIRR